MMHKIDFSLAPSEHIENELSQRIERIRLRQNITQTQLAKEAGVSRSTITRLAQNDKGISLDSFIRIMKALRLTGNLDMLLPDPGLSPLEELKKENQPTRQRARPKKRSTDRWTWEDDGDASS